MSTNIDNYDVIIIGAGQAGLATGYLLEKTKLNYLLIDKINYIGQSWEERYDSLKLFTPKEYSELPGLKYNSDLGELLTKDEVAKYLQKYKEKFNLKVQLNTIVEKLSLQSTFHIKTDKGIYRAKNVIIATGPFSEPYIPYFPELESSSIKQIHTNQYKNPSQIEKGEVLIVGAGNSGAQIAVELSKSHDVIISSRSKLSFKPHIILGKSLFWWLDKLGILNASKTSLRGRLFKNSGDPIIGLELENLINTGKIKLKGKIKSIENNCIKFTDGTIIQPKTIIWATGFKPNYSWITINKLKFDNHGLPIHDRGITETNGLYFLGLSWQYSRNSSLIGGVGKDAKYLVEIITNNKI